MATCNLALSFHPITPYPINHNQNCFFKSPDQSQPIKWFHLSELVAIVAIWKKRSPIEVSDQLKRKP